MGQNLEQLKRLTRNTEILIYIYILHNFVIVYLYFVIRVTRENKFLDISVSRVSKYTKWYTSGLPIEK